MNIASRLKGLNQIYGTDILISETKCIAVLEHMVTRPIDNVAVKGLEGGILIHELVGKTGAVPDSVLAWTFHYAKGYESFLNRDWKSARDEFDVVLKLKPHDAPACLMRERCENWRTTPPGDDWDGVFHAPK